MFAFSEKLCYNLNGTIYGHTDINHVIRRVSYVYEENQ